MGAIPGFRWLGMLALSAAPACHPFQGFADCGSGPIDLESVDVDVEAATESVLGDHVGTLVWTRTTVATRLRVRVARSDRPIRAESDCDGRLDSFGVPLRITAQSEDNLVATAQEHELVLDQAGVFMGILPERTGGPVSFEALKALAITPPDWVSNFSPALSIPLSTPSLAPQSGTVAASDQADPNGMNVVLGEVTFP